MKSLLNNRGDALLFIDTLLQEYIELNAIDTPITLVPSQLSVATEDPPERTVLGTILAARHVAMYAFDDSTAIMLKSLIGNGQGKSYSRNVQPFYMKSCSLNAIT
jgi:hypothetical protein